MTSTTARVRVAATSVVAGSCAALLLSVPAIAPRSVAVSVTLTATALVASVLGLGVRGRRDASVTSRQRTRPASYPAIVSRGHAAPS